MFVLMALIFALVGCAWLLYYYLPGNEFTYFWGFFALAAGLLVLGVLAGLVAAKAVKKGAPPLPNMAIEEARKIRETVSGEDASVAGSGASPAAAPAEPATEPGRVGGVVVRPPSRQEHEEAGEYEPASVGGTHRSPVFSPGPPLAKRP